MTSTLDRVRSLIALGEVKISNHGYDELAQDGILVRDVVVGIDTATVVKDYPNYGKGPCVPVLQHDREGGPIHAVRSIPQGKDSPAVLVTSYRPDPKLWSSDFLRRRP